MKLIPKRKLVPEEIEGGGISDIISTIYNSFHYLTQIVGGGKGFTGTLDDIPDGITYGRVLQTNLSIGSLKIITAQSNLLDMIPATTNTSDLGSSSKEYAEGYIKKTFADTRLKIPVGTDMFD